MISTLKINIMLAVDSLNNTCLRDAQLSFATSMKINVYQIEDRFLLARE